MIKRRLSSVIAILILLLQFITPIANVMAAESGVLLPPSNLAYQATTPDDGKLVWSSVYGATGYNVSQITDGQLIELGTTKTNSYSLNNLAEGNYSYVVSTLSNDGESGPSAPVDVNIAYPTMVTPTSLTATIQNGNDVALNWGTSQYAESYNVYQIDQDGTKKLVATTSLRTYTILNANEGKYTYAVSSLNSLYGESPVSSPINVEVIFPVMKEPANPTFTLTNGNDINLKWQTASYAKSYNVYQVVDGQEIYKTSVTSTNTTFMNMPEGDYLFKIYSYSDRFGLSANGAQITTRVSPITMSPPNNVVSKIVNLNDIVLSWDMSSYADNYNVYQIIDGQRILKSTVASKTVTFTNMSAGDYVYEITSNNNRFGESVDGSQTSLTLEPVIIEKPTNFAYQIKNGNDISLSWELATNATNYHVYQVLNGQKVLKSTVSGNSVNFTNMPAGDYNYQIYSYNSRFGESAEGADLSFTLVLPEIEPPTNPAAEITTPTAFTLSWDASSYATGYKVYQIVDGMKILKNTVSGTTISYNNMQPGDYVYEIHSYSSRFGESPEGSTVSVSLNGQVLDTPANLSYTISNGNDIKLTWSPVQYATSYKIYKVIDGFKILQTTTSATSITYSNQPAGDYYYVVDSYSNLLGESPVGAELQLNLVYPTMEKPINLTGSIQNINDITLKWNPVQYATSYKVYEILDGQEVFTKTVTSTSTLISRVDEGSHTYVVHSVSSRFGESQEGSSVDFTIVFPEMLAPTNLTYTIVNGNDITLKWNSASYATSYNIYQIGDTGKLFVKSVSGTLATLINMPEGNYSYEVHSISDRVGESVGGSLISLSLTFPTMQAPSNLVKNITSGNDINLSWGPSSYATGYHVYQIIDGEKTLVKTVTSTSVRFINMPEGDYSYEVYSYSNRFTESPMGNIIHFNLTWPVVQSPVLQGSIFNANNVTLSWNSVSWANEYRVYEVIGDTKVLLYKGASLTNKVYNLTEEIHSFQVTAYSTRFGESGFSNLVEENIIYPEMQAPVVSVKVTSPSSATLSWNFVTYANGYNVYEVVDGTPVLLVKNLNNLSYTAANLPYKNHEFYVTSYSSSFGESDPSTTVLAKFITDTLPPITTADAPLDWTNNSQVVALHAVDNDTGVAKTYYSLNEGPFLEATSITVEKEGNNFISFYSIDKAGNIEATKTIEVKIDKTAPETETDAQTTWSNKAIQVNLSAIDRQSGVAKTYYSINGADYVEGTTFLVEQEGVNQISFYSVDQAGNKEATKTIEVKIDRTVPVITSNFNDYYKLGSTLNINYSTNDLLSGVANEFAIFTSPDDVIGNVVQNLDSVHLDKPGSYTVTIFATDVAGNIQIFIKHFTVYIPASIEVTPNVIKGNKGVFTVRVNLPEEFDTKQIDLNTAQLNEVQALNSNHGYYNQAKLGQFKFERSRFQWTSSEQALEFRGYINGYLVVGRTTVKVIN